MPSQGATVAQPYQTAMALWTPRPARRLLSKNSVRHARIRRTEPDKTPTKEKLLARIAELEKQASRKRGTLEFKVSEKGGVSVYGLGRFPPVRMSPSPQE